MKKLQLIYLAGLLCLLHIGAFASETLQLINPKIPLYDWSFNNGQEYPGATGEIVILEPADKKHKPALELRADFTGGGQYVQAGVPMPQRDLEAISFWLKAPAEKNSLSIRLGDSSGQCHQLKLRINPSGEWQQIKLPVAKYFSGKTDKDMPEILTHEKWGKESDGNWHNPAKYLQILSGSSDFGATKKGSILISGVTATVGPPKKWPGKEVKLDKELRKGKLTWSFNDGKEFPGATGKVTISKKDPPSGKNSLDLEADFTGGGSYVSIGKQLDGQNIAVIKMLIKTENVETINIRLIDSTKQCHQAKGFKLVPDGEWNYVEIPVSSVAGGEHWGGSNDGEWHGGADSVHIILSKGSSKDDKPQLLISDIRANLEK